MKKCIIYRTRVACARDQSTTTSFRVAAAGQKVGNEFAELLLIYS